MLCGQRTEQKTPFLKVGAAKVRIEEETDKLSSDASNLMGKVQECYSTIAHPNGNLFLGTKCSLFLHIVFHSVPLILFRDIIFFSPVIEKLL